MHHKLAAAAIFLALLAPAANAGSNLVTLTVNDSRGPIWVVAGAPLTLSWISKSVETCYRYGNWGAGTGPLAASGSETVTAPSPTVPTGYLYEIGCFTKHGRYVQSGVQVNVTPP